jgi:hypothetical protein
LNESLEGSQRHPAERRRLSLREERRHLRRGRNLVDPRHQTAASLAARPELPDGAGSVAGAVADRLGGVTAGASDRPPPPPRLRSCHSRSRRKTSLSANSTVVEIASGVASADDSSTHRAYSTSSRAVADETSSSIFSRDSIRMAAAARGARPPPCWVRSSNRCRAMWGPRQLVRSPTHSIRASEARRPSMRSGPLRPPSPASGVSSAPSPSRISPSPCEPRVSLIRNFIKDLDGGWPSIGPAKIRLRIIGSTALMPSWVGEP